MVAPLKKKIKKAKIVREKNNKVKAKGKKVPKGKKTTKKVLMKEQKKMWRLEKLENSLYDQMKML